MSRPAPTLAATLVVALGLTAGALAAPVPAQAATVRTLVAIGDSYPAGTGGNERNPYPQRVAAMLSTSSVKYRVDNRAHGGWRTSDVLYQFDHSDTLAAIARADTVVVTIGANDISQNWLDPRPAAKSTAHYKAALRAEHQRLLTIRNRISKARGGNLKRVVFTTYNNIYQDGSAGARHGSAFVKGADALTKETNSQIWNVCTSSRAACVNVYPAFNVASVNRLVTSDGTHPSSAGHALYASKIHAALRGR